MKTKMIIHAIVLLCLAMILCSCSSGGGGGNNGNVSGSADWTMTIEPASVTASQGSSVMIKVSIIQNAGTSAEVTIAAADTPVGVQTDVLTLPGKINSGYLRLSLTPDIATSGPLNITITGTSGASSVTVHLPLTVTPAEPSSQEKIRVALAAGKIDYGTSLLYRAYALYGDARLPDAFLGSGSEEGDNNLRSEIVAASSGFSVELRAALESFTVRPADTKSWFNQFSTALAPIASRSVMKASVPSSPLPRAAVDASGWKWVSDRRTIPIRVWAQANGDPGYDFASTLAITETLDLFERIWVPMTKLMGEPIYDIEGGDNAIDVYIVDWLSSVHRRGNDFAPKWFGSTFGDFPRIGKKTSGFILIPRSLLHSTRFHTSVIHEFFHVLQYAHNAEINQPRIGVANVIDNYWFTEASARWAAAYYDRTLAPWIGGRGAWDEAHKTFTERFQKSRESLNASTVPHMYDAYIWAYFLEQKAGGPEMMGGIWTNLESASTFAQADNVLDFLFPFKDNFRTFAVRNLNTEFLPGDPLPRSDRYISLDSEFRKDKVEPTYGGGPLTGDSELPYTAMLEPLTAYYLKFTVSDPEVRQVVFDLSGLAAATGLDVDALIKTQGKDWEKRDLNGKDELKFCFNKPDEVLDDIRLIVSNHQHRQGESVLAMLTAKSYKTPCAGAWSGTFSKTLTFGDSSAYQTVVWSGTVTWGHPVIVNGWNGYTEYTVDSAISTITVDGANNGCTVHGQKAVPMSDVIASQDDIKLFSDGSYVAELDAITTVTLNSVCPDPSDNASSDLPFGVRWTSETADGSPARIDSNNHMKGNLVTSPAPTYVSWTWDFAYTP